MKFLLICRKSERTGKVFYKLQCGFFAVFVDPVQASYLASRAGVLLDPVYVGDIEIGECYA